MLGIEGDDWHGCIGSSLGEGCRVLRAQLVLAFPALVGGRQAVYFETQVGQDSVINDVFKENRVRVEGFLRQDDAIIK